MFPYPLGLYPRIDAHSQGPMRYFQDRRRVLDRVLVQRQMGLDDWLLGLLVVLAFQRVLSWDLVAAIGPQFVVLRCHDACGLERRGANISCHHFHPQMRLLPLDQNQSSERSPMDDQAFQTYQSAWFDRVQAG